ncbi:type 1 glutamine amidotransferase family protein [Bacillus infantis]|uniref:type 1 glutamine amidotransferase family protein n=1 Tax=Bacillus infantis TaxID=324767 RepID=UPI003CF229DD
MHTKKAYLYVFDTMSDWEAGYLIAELNSGRYFRKGVAPIEVITVGADRNPVKTMGGVAMQPDLSMEECSLDSQDILILPGGDTWLEPIHEPIHEPILEIASNGLQSGTLVAAICGATMGLANKGLLDTRRHTSNDPGYLKAVCPLYAGESLYQFEPAVADGNLVTASGIAPLEFAAEVLKELDVCRPETLQAWFKLNKTHEAGYFYELMNTVQ